MGCTTSTEARREMLRADAGGPRAARSFSLPSVDRQRLRWKAASVLATLGLATGRHSGAFKYATTSVEEMMKSENDHAAEVALRVRVQETAAKRALKPRTPTLTPPNEPEVINAWELMAGLEDDALTPRASDGHPPPPMWMQTDMDTPVALDFDPEILSCFREALADTSPSPSPSQPTACSITEEEEEEPAQQEKKGCDACDTPISPAAGDMPELSGIVRARINEFQEKIKRKSSKGARDPKVAHLRPPGGEKKAVVYFTSLRGVRKTFVDCCAVRSILRSYGVRVDERDVSMHAVFRAELGDLLGPGFACAALPRVFVDGHYLGAAEDVHAMHEAGELKRALQGCDAAAVRKLGYMEACAACGDVRFVPCETCYGSCKVFVDVDVDGTGEFRRCPDCNENGLIRCPVCCF
ncbi:hypothetical protein GUJ93_ZPchr0004g39861 [Zizania palustris]|uniref:Glutaredoxin domain-containing protein n=1 Tax=Zizania palustris TaxID=103762 RepID=A0A8J5VAT1_ZIZPA|nr:hypothetical protein GUJ93_ZPchr0004g39861 [Zizania palustris]